MNYRPDDLYYRPVLWTLDSGSRWHVTHSRAQSGMNGEVALRLAVVPQLSHAAIRIEVLATGQSVQACAIPPLVGSGFMPDHP